MCLITPFKSKKIATMDMVVYKHLSFVKYNSVTVVKRKWFGLVKINHNFIVPVFESIYKNYRYQANERQPIVEIKPDDEYRASSNLEWDRIEVYVKENYNDEVSFNNISDGLRIFTMRSDDFMCIGSGYHSYSDTETATQVKCEIIYNDLSPLCLVKCIIPAGSEYYEGLGFLVSNQIIVTDDYITL